MRKVLTQNNLSQRSATKTLLAVSFSLSLAALACTTNHTPGNGTPTRSGPEVRTAPTSGITSASESAPALPPPMTSSSRGFDALPVNNGMSTSDNAAATMAAHQRVRVLGPVNPGASASGGAIPVAGAQFNNPALITNPQVTVNSTISSTPTGVITSGTGGSGGVVSGTTSNVAINGVTNNATVAGTNTSGLVLGGNVTEAGAAIFTPATTAVTATPTASAIAVTPGQFAGVAPSPTIASGAVIPPTAATSATLGVLNTTGTTTVTTPVATTATTTRSANVTAAASVGGTATANARIARMRSAGTTTTTSTATSTSNASSVRVLNANGRVTVTNVKPQR